MKTTKLPQLSNNKQIELLLRDALLLPYAPLAVQEWLTGPSFETRLALWCNKYSDKNWDIDYLKDATVRGVYCINCFAKLGECEGGALKTSCPYCLPFHRPTCLAASAIERVIIGTPGEKAACIVLDEYHKFWSRDHDPEQTT